MIADSNGRIVPVHGDHHPVEVYQARKSRNLHSGAEFIGSRLATDGTLYSQSGYAVSHAIPVKAGMVLTKSTASDPYHRWAFYNSTDTYGHFVSASVENTVTVPTAATFARVCYLESEAGSVMVCEGNVALPYEPYGVVTDTIFKPTLLKKSGQTLTFERSYNDSAEVDVSGKSDQAQYSGKNLANPDDISNSHHYYTSGAIMYNVKYLGNKELIPADGSKRNSVTLSYKTPIDASYTGKPWCSIGKYDSNGSFIGYNSTYSTDGLIGWLSEETKYVSFVLWDGHDLVNDGSIFSDIQLELGSTATPYETYVGGIPSPNPDYPQPIESIESVELVSREGSTLGGVGISTSASPAIYNIPLVHVGEKYTIKQFNGTRERVQINLYKDGVFKDYWTPNPNGRVLTANMEFNQIAWVTKVDSEYQGLVDAGTYCTFAMGEKPGMATASTIDLQGHQLRSLPDGTHDELVVKKTGECWINKTVDIWNARYFEATSAFEDTYFASGGIGNYSICTPMCDVARGITDSRVTANYEAHTYMQDGECCCRNGVFDRVYFKGDYYKELKHPPSVYLKLMTSQIINLPSIDPLPTYWPTTVIHDSEGNDISAFVKVID